MSPIATKNGEKVAVKEEKLAPRMPELFRIEPFFAEFFEPRRWANLFEAMQPRWAIPTATFELDLYEKDGKYMIECSLPGFSKEDITINVNGRELTISAKTGKETKEETKEPRYVYRERYKGEYLRTITFQEPLKADLVKAAYENGLLKVEIPIPETEKTKRVPIV